MIGMFTPHTRVEQCTFEVQTENVTEQLTVTYSPESHASYLAEYAAWEVIEESDE